MSKPSYEELASLIKKVYETSKVESVLGVEWVNYPLDVFEEVIDMKVSLEFPDNE